jgi:uncharacterized protein (TIGR02266 family)
MTAAKGRSAENDNAEKREHPRVSGRIAVRFPETSDAARALRAYSLNLSVGGICIRTQREYALHAEVQLSLEIEGENLELKGQVAWVRKDAVGIRFRPMTDPQRARLESLVESMRTPTDAEEVEPE